MQPTDKRVPTVEQWEALADKIDGAGGIKTLTTADYNYPTDNPVYVGLWLLNSGIYRIGEAMTVRGYSGSSGPNVYVGDVIIISKGSGNVTKAIVLTTADSGRVKIYNTNSTTGSSSSYSSSTQNPDVVTARDINATLTSTSNGFPLAASQGKVLADRIGDLSTLTTTAKTSTVAAINEVVATIGNVEFALNIINNGSES